MTDFIDTSFKLVNMIILSVILFYLFRKYILPALKAEMLNDNTADLALANQKILLIQEADLLKQSILKDELEQATLKQRLLFWNKSVDQIKIAHNTSKQELADQIYARKCAIQKKQLLIQTQQNTVSLALTKAEQDLLKFFANEKEGIRYIETLIEHSLFNKGT